MREKSSTIKKTILCQKMTFGAKVNKRTENLKRAFYDLGVLETDVFHSGEKPCRTQSAAERGACKKP
jgi:hypothetical protein